MVAALAVATAGPATTASAGPTTGVRFVVHLDMAGGQRPESITLEPDGSAVVAFAYGCQVDRISPDARCTHPRHPARTTGRLHTASDLFASDVGLGGAGASAEETTMPVIPPP
ncbi:hypothetical protein DWC19_34950 [Streptomyces sp. M7]|nr:hypothetical protein DWC19_34950 [Streptomyces sp. M7]